MFDAIHYHIAQYLSEDSRAGLRASGFGLRASGFGLICALTFPSFLRSVLPDGMIRTFTRGRFVRIAPASTSGFL
jgi:hypothetical protein